MKILIATDAWFPQVNGVVRTLDEVTQRLISFGHEIDLITPAERKTIGLPSYPEIRLAWVSQKEISQTVERFNPDYIHIATEGPIGWAVKHWCIKNKKSFTTSFHTQFAEYVSMRLPLPGVKALGYLMLRHFHKSSERVLTPTKTITDILRSRGFENVVSWTRGVDHQIFKPHPGKSQRKTENPKLVYMGRVAVEKGLEDFLSSNVKGTKIIIGDGPARKALEAKYPEAHFLGYKFGDDLAAELSACDVFVFPSRTDTFGLVMIEAMACGLPVAAYPVAGPVDVVYHGVSGWLDDDLSVAIKKALTLDTDDVIKHAAKFTWSETANMLFDNLVPLSGTTIENNRIDLDLTQSMNTGEIQ